MASFTTVADGLRAIAETIAARSIDSIYVDDNERVVCRVNPEQFLELAKETTITIECHEYSADAWIHFNTFSVNCPAGIEELFRLGLFVVSPDYFDMEVTEAKEPDFD